MCPFSDSTDLDLDSYSISQRAVLSRSPKKEKFLKFFNQKDYEIDKMNFEKKIVEYCKL